MDLQRLGLAPAAIQRQHQLPAQALTQRLARDGGLELRDQLGMAPARQIRLDATLQRDHPALQDAVDLHTRLGRVVQLGQRRPAPHPEPGPKVGRGALGFTRRQRRAAGLQAALETLEVERHRLDPQPIAPPVRLQRPTAAVRSQRPAQLRNVVLQDLSGSGRRTLAPQLVNQTLARDDLVAMQQQMPEHGPLAIAAQSDGSVAIGHFQRPQNPVVRPLPPADATTRPTASGPHRLPPDGRPVTAR